MAGRKADPLSSVRMRAHVANNYQYAATVKTIYSNEGKRIRQYTHWGTLSKDLVFSPNMQFTMSPRKVRDAFIFPEDWDISAARKLNEESPKASLPETGASPRPASSQDSEVLHEAEAEGPGQTGSCGGTAPGSLPMREYKDLLYGSIWLLLQIAEKKHVVEDLMATFEYKRQVVDDILTLAIFPYLTRKNYDRLAHEQRISHYPSGHELTSPYITRFTQFITPQNRMDFCKLRVGRQPDGAYFACDSTTRSAWGKCIAEIHYGRNKDNRDMDCTLEVVVYSLTTHEPVYYRTFPGNEPDARTVRTIISDMRHLGVKDLVTIYDRGYESADNFDEFFRDGLAFISCAKVAQEPVINCLLEIQYDEQGLPINMKYDPEERLFYAQFMIENRTYADSEGNTATVDGHDYKCNAFLNPAQRPYDLISVNNSIEQEFKMLEAMQAEGLLVGERGTINRRIRFHSVLFSEDPKNNRVTADIVQNAQAVRKAKASCGFFSSVSYKAPGDALDMLRIYRIRDEQEKYFEQMKDQMDFHTVECSSQDGKSGRDFILFVGLILSSTLRSTWKHSVELRKQFKTSLSVLDEMADIRWIRHEDGEEHMSEFMSSQVEICKAYGIRVPLECLPSVEKKAEEKKMNPKKKGRKPKGTAAPNKIRVIPC